MTSSNFEIHIDSPSKDPQSSSTKWHNGVVWRSLAQLASNYLKKGHTSYLEGKIKTRSYADKTGETRYITEIIGDNLIVLDKPKKSKTRNGYRRHCGVYTNVSGHLMTTSMQETNDILNLKVSFQENTWTNVSAIEPTIKSVLEDIQSDKYKQQVTDLRTNLKNGNTDYYNDNKKRLPAVTFSATFSTNRTRDKVKNYNSLIVIDIDKLNEDQIAKCYDKLLEDEFVFSFWRSPSNKGFKGLVQLEFIDIASEIDLDAKHKSAFKKLSNYFQNNYNLELDKSGSDISRLCFLSYDKQLVRKVNYKKFQVSSEDINVTLAKTTSEKTRKIKFISDKDALFNPYERNNQYDRKLMSDIIRHLTNKNLSITYSYANWCKVAMAIANSFTYDIGLKYFAKLSKLDGTKYNEIHCTNFLINCYETKNGNVNFASIIHLANEKGYKTKQQKIKEGVPKVEV